MGISVIVADVYILTVILIGFLTVPTNSRIWGVYDGYRGLVDDNMEELTSISVADIIQRVQRPDLQQSAPEGYYPVLFPLHSFQLP